MTFDRGGGIDEMGVDIVEGVELEEIEGMEDWYTVVGATDGDEDCIGVGLIDEVVETE